MKTVLLIALALVWLVTVAFAYSGLMPGGPSGPSIGQGLGQAIAIMIALVGALLSAGLLVWLYVRFELLWPVGACGAFALVVWAIGTLARSAR